jgi:hypothetical protein
MDALPKAQREKFEGLDQQISACTQGVVEKLAVYIRAHASEITPVKEEDGQRYS